MRTALFLLALQASAAVNGWVGSKTCAGCHDEIYRKYSRTQMASTSGLTGAGVSPEKFDRAVFTGHNGAYTYSVGRGYEVEFRKTDSSEQAERRTLKYFVGSGTAGRSYLIDIDGFLYQAPVTYYGASGAWNLSPGYTRYSYPYLTRAIAPDCLSCHASGIQPIAETQNGYQSPPFLEGGVSCERCHGPGAAHAASGRPQDIVNPAKLIPAKRDSVCSQCHLSGEVRVDRAGRKQQDFAAGDDLADYVVAFAREGSSPHMRVTSHVENLAQSACRRASGERMWCGSCHDPHFVPAPGKKAAWFRAKCLACHATNDCKETRAARAARKDDCTGCHMQRAPVEDADHVVYTDHSIPRRPQPAQRAFAESPLAPLNVKTVPARDLGLAYAIVGLREQNEKYRDRAFLLLRQAEDPDSLSYLAELYRARKDDMNAMRLYERLMKLDPAQSAARAALGAYQMAQGHYEEAIRLWREALRISPALVSVRLNLALALARTGRPEEAVSILEKALEFNPSFNAARDLLAQLRLSSPRN